jgi:DNA-binding transcriptional regulator YdaS (Cro superfamily)
MTNIVSAAAESVGGMAKLAALMGEDLQTVWNWQARGVPVPKCAAMEAACGGVVKRWHMRPADWYSIWPELVGQEGAPEVVAA